jgi:hypothetical protein
MIDQDRLMAIFQYLSSEKKVVKLYNTYRGIPLDMETTILEVEQDTITASLYGYQAVSLALEGQTHLQAPSLPDTLRATVVDVDIKKRRAVLRDFTSLEGKIGMRKLLRVEPSETLEVRIYDGRQRIGGRVLDISGEGMCIYTFFARLYGLKFERDKEVFVDFKPPFTTTAVRSKGIITRLINREGTSVHRLGLKIYPSREVKPLLEDYIKRRQKELLNEIEQNYLSLSRKKFKRG